MPISSSAVVGDFSPTPFYTHILKSGEPLESVRPDVTPDHVETDLSTVEMIPSEQKKTTRPFFGSKLCQYSMAVLVAILAAAAIGIPLGIVLSMSTSTTTIATTTTILSNTTLTTVTTTTATTTTTTVTTSTIGASLFCSSSETIYAVWNTTTAGDSTPATNGTTIGTYFSAQSPGYVCDNNIYSTYTAFGACTSVMSTTACGLNTGYYRTPQRGASLITGLQVATAGGLTARDPITITFEGSTQSASSLTLGSSWTLIYSGPSGLATDPGRSAWGSQISFTNTVWYTSYRFLVTSKRGSESSTWYGEVLMTGY